MEDYSGLEKEVIENLFIEFPWLIDLDYEYYATLRFDVYHHTESIIVLKNMFDKKYALLYVHYGKLDLSHHQKISAIRKKGIEEWANYDRTRQPEVIVIAENYSEDIKDYLSSIDIMEYGSKLDDLLTSEKTVYNFFED